MEHVYGDIVLDENNEALEKQQTNEININRYKIYKKIKEDELDANRKSKIINIFGLGIAAVIFALSVLLYSNPAYSAINIYIRTIMSYSGWGMGIGMAAWLRRLLMNHKNSKSLKQQIEDLKELIEDQKNLKDESKLSDNDKILNRLKIIHKKSHINLSRLEQNKNSLKINIAINFLTVLFSCIVNTLLLKVGWPFILYQIISGTIFTALYAKIHSNYSKNLKKLLKEKHILTNSVYNDFMRKITNGTLSIDELEKYERSMKELEETDMEVLMRNVEFEEEQKNSNKVENETNGEIHKTR